MDFLLVLPLTLSFLTTGLSDTNDSKCITMCPAGSHRADKCTCQPCETGFYTEISNERPKCLKCSKCKKHAEQIKACVPDSNVVCACKDGFYSDKPDIAEDCKRCPCEECRRNKITRKCEECDRCMNNSDCTRQCKLLPMTTSTTLSANLTTTVSVHGFTTGGSLGLHKAVNRVFWMILAAAVASLLVLLWLLLFCLEKLVKLSTRCPCWAEPKGQEPPRAELKSNKQFSHQNCSPCVMIFDTSEEPPSLSLSPANPEHPDSVAPLLPSAKQKDEQAEAWPAVVLYAIIREVPLRRWKEFLRLLSLSDQQMDRVELEAGLSSTERQYQMLRLWSMRSSACLGDVLCALHHMELSGCAQLLKESLEEMHWTTEVRLQVGATDPAGWHGEAVPGKNAT